MAILLLATFPFSEIAIQSVNTFWTQVIPIKLLAKLELKDDLPTQHPTIVVVPSMLTRQADVNMLLTKLESHYLANAEPSLKFALLTDFADADSATVLSDSVLIELASVGIEKLNDRYETPLGHRPFFLFHRRRTWNPSQGKWMGWERKRGKLIEFGKLLQSKGGTSYETCVGDLNALARFSDPTLEPFVITLDADTTLPRDTARRLIGALAHPLNRPHYDSASGMVRRGYGILQPRVSIQMENDVRSWYHWLFATEPGIDPYASSASDIYQDIYREGSFTGKGIYDLRAFESALEARFPENRILSHDLIEGCHARVAYASDIEVFDSYPQRYDADSRRQHRWTRGDWQIATWLLKNVPTQHSTSQNRLSLLSRWKIFDNLRRSLVPITVMLLLLACFALKPSASIVLTSIVTCVVFWPPLLAAVFGLRTLREIFADEGTDRRGYVVSYGGNVGRAVLRSLYLVSILPHRAWLMTDAISRTLWRVAVSHTNLLEWETAYASEARLTSQNNSLVRQFFPSALLGLILLLTAIFQQQPWLLPWSCLWILSPPISHACSLARGKKTVSLSGENSRFLLELLTSTWGYFERFVDPASNPLPPDNFQEEPTGKIAHRISPTNEGLFLVSAVTARHFGLFSHSQLAECLERNLDAWLALERYNGHHFNWYDTKSGRALPPRYVSTVDSGNLLACYLTLGQGLKSEIQEPIVGSKHFEASHAAIDWLRRVGSPLDALCADYLNGLLDSLIVYDASWCCLRELKAWLLQASERIEGWSREFAATHTTAVDPSAQTDVVQTAQIVVRRFRGLIAELDILLPWITNPTDALDIDKEVQLRLEKLVPASISLAELASLDLSSFDKVWLERGQQPHQVFLHHLTDASKAAQQLIVRFEATQSILEQEIDGMQFGFLYNRKRKLFSIGLNAETMQLDKSYYDMLASECRLSSYLAIAKGEVKTEHWFHLGRQSTEINGRFGLLSWGGTMFEYLMPTLFQRAYPDSILERSCLIAIRRQIQYGLSKAGVWGVSESAYSARANNADYLYKSFGVPGLGLKRGLAREYVVSPYSSVLALPLAPPEAMANLTRLAQMALGTWGFFDAVDFTKSRLRKREPYVVVRNYMAHHQGMSILAIANALDRSVIQRWFHNSPMVRAAELLLQEKPPAVVTIDKPDTNETDESIVRPDGEAIFTRRIRGYRASPPKTLFLSNRRAHVLLTHVGGSCFRWNDIQVTRWRPDVTRDQWGTHCYLRDHDSGMMWSAAYQPTRIEPDEYEVHFAVDKGSIRRRQGSIETTLEVTVSPEHDAEVRLLRIANLGVATVTLDVTSFAEIALVNERSDLAHPAFYKLFVETEFVPEDNSIVAKRRPRDNRSASICAVHTISVPAGSAHTIQYDCSRESFIGRGRTCESPAGMDTAQLQRNVGPVVDPAFALRCTVSVPPGESVLVGFTTACATTRAEVLAIADHYQELRGVQRAFELAWAQSQIEVQHLNLSAQELHCFQRLGGNLIYPHRALRGDAVKIMANRLGQSSLWRFGISGDYPMILARITSDQDVELVKQLLIACRYLASRGVQAELVLCNDFPGSYHDEIQHRLQALVEETMLGEEVTKIVFVLRGAQLTREDHQLLDAVATVLVRGDHGSLADQLDVAPFRFSQPLRPLAVGNRLSQTTTGKSLGSAQVAPDDRLSPSHEGQYANEFGSFVAGAYQMELSGECMTPAPWSNVLSNPDFGCLITESGSGYTWYKNSRENKISSWSNDPTSDPPSEVLYVYDLDSEQLWSPLNVLASPTSRRVEHRHGASSFHLTENSIASETTVSVDWNKPLKRICLKLRNTSGMIRRLRITYCVETVLGVNRELTALHQHSALHSSGRAILVRNGFHADYPQQIVFLTTRQPDCRFTGDRTEFLDPFGSYQQPTGAIYRLNNRTGAALDPCLAVQFDIELQVDELREMEIHLGAADNEEQLKSLLNPIAPEESEQHATEAVASEWAKILGGIVIETPDRSMDILFNDWLLYQTLACRIWGRSAFYQSGGAFGFRDQLQDVMAMVYRSPTLTRQQILLAASRQYTDGSVQHWWHPPTGKGTKTRFSDDFLFLPFAVSHYCTVTGDREILDEQISFVESLPLMEHEQERYEEPTISEHQATLLEHCRRALQHGMQYGVHGLPLMGCGDWNDGMNRIGEGGKGESVWVGWFQVQVFRDFAELVEMHEPTDDIIPLLRTTADNVLQAIETHAWEGQWYRRAFFDDGTALGESTNEECQIDSLAQSWAVIVNGMTERTSRAYYAAVNRLYDREAQLVKLFDPPFDHEVRSVGYVQGYLPGVRENGGQYTHAALWMVSAAAKLGNGELAIEMLNSINPIQRSASQQSSQRYRLEPYVIAADVYANTHLMGRGGWSWYTGSAGWMYRVILEDILGLKFVDGRVSIRPSVPLTWPQFKVTLIRNTTRWNITVHLNLADSSTASNDFIDLIEDGQTHEVVLQASHKRAEVEPTTIG